MHPRPPGIFIATALMSVSLVAWLVLAFTTPTPRGMTFFLSSDAGIGSVITAALETAVLIAFYNGMNWARWAVIVFSVFCLLALKALPRIWEWDPVWGALYAYRAALSLGLVVYLDLDRISRWFETATTANRKAHKA